MLDAQSQERGTQQNTVRARRKPVGSFPPFGTLSRLKPGECDFPRFFAVTARLCLHFFLQFYTSEQLRPMIPLRLLILPSQNLQCLVPCSKRSRFFDGPRFRKKEPYSLMTGIQILVIDSESRLANLVKYWRFLYVGVLARLFPI